MVPLLALLAPAAGVASRAAPIHLIVVTAKEDVTSLETMQILALPIAVQHLSLLRAPPLTRTALAVLLVQATWAAMVGLLSLQLRSVAIRRSPLKVAKAEVLLARVLMLQSLSTKLLQFVSLHVPLRLPQMIAQSLSVPATVIRSMASLRPSSAQEILARLLVEERVLRGGTRSSAIVYIVVVVIIVSIVINRACPWPADSMAPAARWVLGVLKTSQELLLLTGCPRLSTDVVLLGR